MDCQSPVQFVKGIGPQKAEALGKLGVRTAEDTRRLRRAGAANLLVGEALVRAPDPGALLREMTS
mgnify:CR=1 FL=1